NRLYRSREAIRIHLDVDHAKLTELLIDLMRKKNMTTDGNIYLQGSGGSATSPHVFTDGERPTISAYIVNVAGHLENLANEVKTITLPHVLWDNCYVKCLNLLPNVLAKQTAMENGCYEAILHLDGKVTECSSSNAYLVKDGKIYTHPTTKRILHGCVRM